MLFVGAFIPFSFLCEAKTANSEIQNYQAEIEKKNQEIRQHDENIRKNKESIRQIQGEIDRIDSQIKNIERQLHELNRKKTDTQHELMLLRTQQKKLSKEKDIQIQILSRQLVEAYKLGSSDYVKLVFNQEDPNLIGRMLEYHIYINKARTDLIENISKLSSQIELNETEITGKTRQNKQIIEDLNTQMSLYKVKKDEKEKISAIKKEQTKQEEKEREVAVKAKKDFENALAQAEKNKRMLEAKKKQENDEKIAKAQEEAKKTGKSEQEAAQKTIAIIENEKLKGLKGQKGSLTWPVTGRIVKNFGSARAGELKWTGILIQSRQPGQHEVVSVAEGDVVGTNHITGYGMIAVIDHGEGYMSVYGNNKTITRKVGEHVKKGELIGYYDDTNGYLEESLYFELRYNGSPINPVKWLKKK